MDSMQSLRAAREAVRQGNRREGRRLLHQVLCANPNNEVAWLWLSAIVDDPIQERRCLERVLRINPDNQIAQRHLSKFVTAETSAKRAEALLKPVVWVLAAIVPVLLLVASVSLLYSVVNRAKPGSSSIPSPSETPIPDKPSLPTPAQFQSAACQFEIPQGETVDCGYVILPQNRDRLNKGEPSPAIRLHVAIYRSRSEHPAPDPVIYLSGGPGGHALDRISWGIDAFETILADRDLIVFDQRGVGYSEPSLDCPEAYNLFFETLDLDLGPEEGIKLNVEANLACRNRLIGEGVDLEAYNSAENASDVHDLQLALGYEEWNLFGVSYGTRLALTVMRDHPEGVRSVILDSTYPPQVDLYARWATNAERAFALLFDRCAADAVCDAAYPELETTYYDLVTQLNLSPITVQVTNPLTEKETDLVIDGDDMIGLLLDLLYDTGSIRWLPKLILDTYESNDDYGLLSYMLQRSFFSNLFLSEGMYYSVQCGEEVRFSTLQTVTLASASVQPRIKEPLDTRVRALFTVCDAWGAKEAGPIENELVLSDIPTLVLAGEYDPITPPAWGKTAAETLTHAYYFTFLGVGHGVFAANDCAKHIATSFLAAPNTAPDSSCIDAIKAPDFITHY